MPGIQELKTAIVEGKITLNQKYKSSIAAFDVDCQNGFSPRCPGELPVEGATEIVEELNKQATFAGVRVASKDAHCLSAVYHATPTEPQFTPITGYPDADLKWNAHCIMGTYGAELLEGLPAVTDYDYFVWKGIEPTMHPYGACYHDAAEKMSTGVIEFLNERDVDTVITSGLATDFCLKRTALQLHEGGFEVIVNLGACRGITPETVKAAIEEFHEAGIYVLNNTAELEDAVNFATERASK